MIQKIRWGILGAAQIGINKVIPAMQKGEFSQVIAIASRDLTKAQAAATKLGIPKAYGSYEELLQDPEIDAIYNPLPNHMHVPWSIKAAAAGKHVLCEKPIGMSAAECEQLIAARDRYNVKIGEAFMVRSHPQWLRARELARSGEIGGVRAIVGIFSYFNVKPENIRNVPEYGGGALMDIGCYPIQLSRFIFGEEPVTVHSAIELDPTMGTDRLTSAVLQFPSGHAIFTCSTQMSPYQKANIIGTKGRIELEIPFNAPPDKPSRIFVEIAGVIRTEEFPACDQYTLQGDAFSQAILGHGDVPTPLEDSLANMRVIDTLFHSETFVSK